IRFCKQCGEPIDMSPENVAECQAIRRAEFAKTMADPTLALVCESCYAKLSPPADSMSGSADAILIYPFGVLAWRRAPKQTDSPIQQIRVLAMITTLLF